MFYYIMVKYQLNSRPCLISGNVVEERINARSQINSTVIFLCSDGEQSNERKFLGYNLEGNVIFLSIINSQYHKEPLYQEPVS